MSERLTIELVKLEVDDILQSLDLCSKRATPAIRQRLLDLAARFVDKPIDEYRAHTGEVPTGLMK